MTTTYFLADADSTRDFGAALASHLCAGDVIVLTGGLGAGKTTLTQGIGAGLGVRGRVTSPTFTISRIHPADSGKLDLVHVDAYRLNDFLDLETVDLEATMPTSVTVIEWGEGMAEEIAPERLHITIDRSETLEAAASGHEITDDAACGPRVVTLEAVGQRWRDSALLDALKRYART